MATLKDLEATVAALTERVALLESRDPQLARERALAERRDRKAKLKSLDLKGYARLTGAERDEWVATQPDDRIVELLREADAELRDDVLSRLGWQRKAYVTFQLAPAPDLRRVTNPEGYRTRPLTVTEAQAKTLADAGVRVGSRERHAGQVYYTVAPWPVFDGQAAREMIFDAAAWEARLDVDPELRELVDAGAFTVERLDDDAARKYATERYLHAYIDKRGVAGARGPELPALD